MSVKPVDEACVTLATVAVGPLPAAGGSPVRVAAVTVDSPTTVAVAKNSETVRVSV
jgi:hypothetical protein